MTTVEQIITTTRFLRRQFGGLTQAQAELIAADLIVRLQKAFTETEGA